MANEPECRRCRFFGRTVHADRLPSGSCCKQSAGSYTVQREEWIQWGTLRLRKVEEIPTPFPPVWPTDFCGQFEAKEKGDMLPIEQEAK